MQMFYTKLEVQEPFCFYRYEKLNLSEKTIYCHYFLGKYLFGVIA